MVAKFFHLTDLVSEDILEDIVIKFYKATKMSALITDYQGRPITSTDHFLPLCRKIRKIPELCDNCVRSDAYAGIKSTINRIPQIYQCHSGLVDVSIPIIINNNYVGLLLTGQVLLKEEDMSEIHTISQDSLDYSLYPELLLEFNEFSHNQRKLSLEELKAYSNLLSLTANYVGELGYKMLMQEKLKEQEIQVLEAKRSAAEEKANSAQMALKAAEEAQLEPGFLYETFNSIYQHAILEDAKETAALIYSFTTLLNQNLKHKISTTTIKEELKYLDNFILIKNSSRLYKFEINYNVDSDCLNCEIPVKALQSLMENVLILSTENIEIDCILNISIFKRNNMVYIELENSQYFFPPLTFQEMKNTKLFHDKFFNLSQSTIKNILHLLEECYHDNFEFLIAKISDHRSKIVLIVPDNIS